jgi:hypothetical protein
VATLLFLTVMAQLSERANRLVDYLPSAIFLCSKAGDVAGAIGCWLLTTPDPAKVAEERFWNLRRLARYTAVIGALARTGLLEPTPLDLGWAGKFAQFLTCLGFVAMLLCGRRLALRMGCPRLAAASRIVATGWGISGILAVLCSVSIPHGPVITVGPPHYSTLHTIIRGTAVVSALGVIVFGLWAVAQIFYYRSNLRNAARIAQTNWAAAPGAPAQPAGTGQAQM